jgi:L-seryl-tRNA(Ser) seleniumtransferase
MSPEPFREIPSVAEAVTKIAGEHQLKVTQPALTRLVQRALERSRDQIAGGTVLPREDILRNVMNDAMALQQPRLVGVLNATGIILHTNLGRAPVSRSTSEAMAAAASSYVPLEIDPETNDRGGRMTELTNLMQLLTGADSTLVVNNNAAAVLLTLSALAAGREVIVSRSEAVEIGGGFRIPDVMRQSGAELVEVGTTNRTYARDFQNAVSERTAAILTVHQSNFRIEGFTTSPKLEELVAIGQSANVPVLCDLGSGALLDASQFGLAKEPTIQKTLEAGASIVTASGDKLLGGPQAGIICGDERYVRKVERHPLARAVRADKACLAGLAATLRHYLQGEAVDEIPVWGMIAVDSYALRARAELLAAALPELRDAISVVSTEATTGGGSMPGELLPSWGLSLGATGGMTVDDLAFRLRTGQPRVFGRIRENRLILDLRTVLPEDDSLLLDALHGALAAG